MAQSTFARWGALVLGAPFPMSAEQLLRWQNDARGYELVEGRLIWVTPAGSDHGGVEAEVGGILRDFVKPRRLGRVFGAETGFLVSQPGEPDTVLAPDAAYVRAEHVPAKGSPAREGFWRVVPDLVVEVASPSQYRPEMEEKAQLWIRVGVRLVWVIWPKAEQVAVYQPGSATMTLSGADTLAGFEVLPGFTCPVTDVFEEWS